MGGAKRIQLWRAVYNSILKSGNTLYNNFKILPIKRFQKYTSKLQSYRAESFTILLNDISKQLRDARPLPSNASAKTYWVNTRDIHHTWQKGTISVTKQLKIGALF